MIYILSLQLISIISFCGFYLYFSIKNLSNLNCYPFFITSVLILISYILALVGFLNIGTLFIHIVGVTLFILNLKSLFFSKKNNFQGPFFTFLISITLIALGLFFNDAKIYYWDDLTHWAIVSRDIYIYNEFPNPSNGSDFYIDYPPGAALFHYYFLYPLKISSPSNYLETNALFSQATILISCGLCFVKFPFKKSKFYNLCVLLTILLLIYSGSEGFNSLMVDSLIGIYFGSAIFLVLNGKSNFDYFNVALASIAIALLKPTGIIFSLVTTYVLIITIIYNKNNCTNSSTITSYSWKKILIIFSLLITTIFSMKFSWNIYVDSVSLPVWKYKFKFEDLFDLFSNTSSEQKQIILNFYTAIKPNLSLSLKDFRKSSENYIFQYYFYLILIITIYSLINIKNRLLYIISINLYITFIGYCLVLLFTYLFLFTIPDGIALASFSRYVSSFSICLVLFVFAIIFYNQFKNYKLILIFILLPLLINPIYVSRLSHTFFTNPNHRIISTERLSYSNLLMEHPTLRSKSSKIILLSECSSGFDRLLFSYDLFPAKVARFPQLTPDCNDSFLFGNSLVFDNFNFNEYDFLIIVKGSTWFLNSYGIYFDNLNGTFPMLFKISIDQNSLKFIRIE